MLVKTYGYAVTGINATQITIEVNMTTGINFFLVGLPDSAVKESQQRIIAAIKNCASIPDTEKRANAMLIYAAPDLLNALVDLLGVCYDLEINDETVKAVANARAAVTKAKGE
jgi:predicted ATPase with chaperone activity